MHATKTNPTTSKCQSALRIGTAALAIATPLASLAITPAKTLAGIVAKAGALSLAVLRERIWTGEVDNIHAAAKIEIDEMGRRDGWLARSLCDDILAMGRVGV